MVPSIFPGTYLTTVATDCSGLASRMPPTADRGRYRATQPDDQTMIDRMVTVLI